MAEYQDYKSYGAYLGRLFVVFVGIVLVGVLFWYVLGLFTGDDDSGNVDIKDPTVSLNDGETQTTDTTDNTSQNSNTAEETPATNDNAVSEPSASEAAQDREGQTLATNSEALPNTGIEHVIGAVATPFILGAGYSFIKSRRTLGKSFNA